MKKREHPLTDYETPRDITIKNVRYETAATVTDRGFVYVSALPELKNKKVIILIQE